MAQTVVEVPGVQKVYITTAADFLQFSYRNHLLGELDDAFRFACPEATNKSWLFVNLLHKTRNYTFPFFNL